MITLTVYTAFANLLKTAGGVVLDRCERDATPGVHRLVFQIVPPRLPLEALRVFAVVTPCEVAYLPPLTVRVRFLASQVGDIPRAPDLCPAERVRTPTPETLAKYRAVVGDETVVKTLARVVSLVNSAMEVLPRMRTVLRPGPDFALRISPLPNLSAATAEGILGALAANPAVLAPRCELELVPGKPSALAISFGVRAVGSRKRDRGRDRSPPSSDVSGSEAESGSESESEPESPSARAPAKRRR